MILKKIHLVHFRNYENNTFYFGNGINYIVGRNAQGKTNLIESIYYCSTTKTHRNVEDECLIQKNNEAFKIEASLFKKNHEIEMMCIFSKSGKNLFLYHNPIRKVSDFVGFMNAVIFSPNDMNLFSAQPKVRRKFMDIELSKCSKSYMYKLNEFYHLLKQRNAYLKSEKVDLQYLSILDEKCAQLQSVIIHQRAVFLSELTSVSQKFYEQLSDDQTKFSIVYKTFIEIDDEKSMTLKIMQLYQNNVEKDMLLKTTDKGIHKDDFILMIDDKNAEEFASQGQKRTILLALKIGIVKLIEKIIQDEPILLLDDVFSELDENRRETLLDLLPKNIQIFISTTEKIQKNYNRDFHMIMIENGNEVKEDIYG